MLTFPSLAKAQEESLGRIASSKDMAGWASEIQAKYPSVALRNGEQGTVRMRVRISVQGRVDSCKVTQSSGSYSLDEAGCSGMIQHARYEPALDDTGEPISSYISQAITYAIPENTLRPAQFEHPAPVGEGNWRSRVFTSEYDSALQRADAEFVVFQLVIDENGVPAGCGMNVSSGDAMLDRQGCDALKRHARFTPAVLPQGDTIPGSYWVAHTPGLE